MSSSPAFPPVDGSIPVLPGFVDFHANHNPDRPWAVFPEGSSARHISFKEFADATHRIAHALRPDKQSAAGEIVALVINCDSILYLALLAGLVRAGFVPFPMSPRNSVPAFVHMLEKTSCHRIISQATFGPVMDSIKTHLKPKCFAVHVDQLPALHDIFPSLSGEGNTSPVELFPPSNAPYNPEDIVMYIHSSGSTGFPKPIPQRQNSLLQWCTVSTMTETRKRDLTWGGMALPTFHTIAIVVQLLVPLATGHAVGLYTPMAPAPPVVPTPANLMEACKITGISAITIVPSIIEAWVQSEENVEYLKTLKLLVYVGGPLSERNGEKLIAAGVPLFPVYGGTETGPQTLLFDRDDSPGRDPDAKTSADWSWFSFPKHLNLRWDPQGDGSYELQFLRSENYFPAIENLPDVRGYATNDLFIPHPTKKGLWKITGRKDDVIVLGTGEKVVPIPQEGLIGSNAMVAGVVMFGRGKNECGVLIEPRAEYAVDPSDPAALVEFRNKIWPIVEEANKIAPTFARLFKEMILVTDPAKPLPRASKGTVIRPQALNLYADEIEKLYQTVSDSADSRGIAPPATWSADDILTWLLEHSSSINDEVEISPSRDMFDQGFDSLHATFLRNRIVATIRSSKDPEIQKAASSISQNFIFDHPTLNELASAIAAIVSPSSAGAREVNTATQIEQMLAKYAQDLSRPIYPADKKTSKRPVVLLTGSTGNVGSHILVALLREAQVQKVYTLNRPSSSVHARQEAAFVERGLPVDLLSDTKLVQLAGDVTAENFGLESAIFEQVKQEVTQVVHNAWRVDFNLSLSSFEKYVAGTRRLIDILGSLPRPAKLFFTSSVAAAYMWDTATGAVPEEVLKDPFIGSANGYGASKFVGENLLGKAAENGIQCTSLRVGQVCGSKDTGAWGTSEWVPIIVKSSVALGVLPDLDGVVSWIPMDAVAQIVADLVISDEQLPPLLNVVHPRPSAWRKIFANINMGLGKEPLPLVRYEQWLEKLESIASKGASRDLERVPALKLLPFFRSIAVANANVDATSGLQSEAGGIPAFDTAKLQRYSPSTRTLEPLDEAHTRAWIGYWKAQGFLNI